MSTLKKALGKLNPDRKNHSPARSSNVSDDEKLGSPHRSSSLPAQSPSSAVALSPRQSGTFTHVFGSRGDVSSNDDSKKEHRQSGSFAIRASAVREKLGLQHSEFAESDVFEPPLNKDGEPMSKNQMRKTERDASRERRRQEAEQREEELRNHRREMEERAASEETPEMRKLYGRFPVNHYGSEEAILKKEKNSGDRVAIKSISGADVGKVVTFRARIHHIRKLSAHLVFLVFRQSTSTIQGVLQEHGSISPFFLYWAEHLEIESLVLVRGVVQDPKSKQGEIEATTIHDAEISVHELHVEGGVSAHTPFTVEEAEVPPHLTSETDNEKRQRVSDRTKLANRVLDLRTTSAQSIFRIQGGMSRLFREYLDSQGFVEIHTPKLQGGATESGATVFKLDYFGRPAFLAQSPQLAKQMAIASDFGRVYEIGPVFRAENSNTHRHMTEFTGMDLEMAIDEHYHEVLRMLDNTFKHIFEGLYRDFRQELDIVKRYYPHEDLVWLEETPRIPFAEGVRMLNESGWRNESGKELPENEDLGTRDEIQLGKLIKEKYKTDFYVLDKFPASARPFYAMPDPENPEVTNSFDIFLRGQEILSGGQRIHDGPTLLSQMEKLKIDRGAMEEYVSGFEWGAPPHGGGGIGLERMLMLLLSLGNIRLASMFYRDPKSFPTRPITRHLRHPEASTLHPPWENKDRIVLGMDYQPIEKLIANYGDASNTSWLEERTEIWRDDLSGSAVGFVPQDGYAIIIGNPLCHSSQYYRTATGFLRYVRKHRNLKPLWLLVGSEMEEVLATRFNWRTFSVAAELRVDPTTRNAAGNDSEVQRKIRKAEKEGVRIYDIPLGGPVPDDIRQKCDERVQDWLAHRKGKQVHLTDIHLWQDMEHRLYHYAVERGTDTIVAIVVMAQLSIENGYQVKYALDFPNAPSGTIELIITHALRNLATKGETNVTFGGGASSNFTPGHNLKGTRVKVLSKAYHAIASELRLTAKSEFREKLGAHEDAVYICYPSRGLGPTGVKAILNFFEDE